MTVVSTPALSSRMAAVCRRTCGVIVLLARVGQVLAAVAAWVARRCWTASGLSGVPLRVGNSGSVAAPALEVVQERADERGVKVGDVQVGGRLAGVLGGEGQQQLAGVSVGGDGVAAGVALAGQPVGEERLQGRGERAHGRPAWPARWASRRCAASASSSGAACRYQ